MQGLLRIMVGAFALGLILTACSSGDSGSDADQDAAPATSSSPEPTYPAVKRYIALGDSYTAAPLLPGTKKARGCLRSIGNYPNLVSKQLGPAKFVDRSCSGADTASVTGQQETLVGLLPPQINAVNRATDLVTLGIGGNDADVFETMVNRCPQLRRQDPQGSPCRDAMRAGGGDLLLDRVAETEDRIVQVIQQINSRAPSAKILVVGYPQIVPPQGTCPRLLPLAKGDYQYGRTINRRLTEVVERAAKRTNATYIDVWRGTAGHDICSDDPWVNGQTTEPGKALAFHPFAAGQEYVADRVLRVLD